MSRTMTSALVAVFLAAFLTFASVPASAQDESQLPVARASVTPGEAVTVGQPVTVEVEVLVPTFFRNAPRFPDLDVADALVVFNDRGRNLTERRGGRTWAGQSRSYTIYPQRPGSFEIERIDIALSYSAGGSDVANVRVSPPPVRFEATVPEEAAELDYFIATSALSLEEIIEVAAPAGAAAAPTIRTLRVGESLTRTVTVTVQDALSMVVPPLDLGSPDGLAAYPAQPQVTDTGGERGARIVGTRVESTTFVAEREGRYTLPAVELAWWDVTAGALQQASAAALEVEVVANPDLAPEFALPGEDADRFRTGEAGATRISVADTLRRWGPVLLGVVILLYVGRRSLQHLGLDLEQLVRGDAAAREERRRFRAFRQAARSQQAAETARAFMRWLDFRGRRPGTYRAFAVEAQDSQLDREARSLGDSLYGKRATEPAAWSGRALAGGVERVRRRARERKEAAANAPVLPPLNP